MSRGRNSNKRFSWKKRLWVWKERIRNISYRYADHFRKADAGRWSEFRRARKKLIARPWLLFVDVPEPPMNNDPVDKMVFGMLQSPVWEYDMEESGMSEELDERPLGYEEISNEQMLSVIRKQQERQRESDVRKSNCR